jgi:hypothetical protein
MTWGDGLAKATAASLAGRTEPVPPGPAGACGLKGESPSVPVPQRLADEERDRGDLRTGPQDAEPHATTRARRAFPGRQLRLVEGKLEKPEEADELSKPVHG